MTTEEFAMPIDLSPEHAAPVIPAASSPPEAVPVEGLATLETLELPADLSTEEPQSCSQAPEHEQEKVHNGIRYTGPTPPDFTHVQLTVDIQDHHCLIEPIEEDSVFEVVKFDGNDSTVAIQPHGCKTIDGLYWLQPEEYEVVIFSDKSDGPQGDDQPETSSTEAEPVAAQDQEIPEGLTKSQRLRFQHHQRIIEKQRQVDCLLEVWEDAKSEAKRAKEDYEKAVDELQKLIRTDPTQMLLTERPPSPEGKIETTKGTKETKGEGEEDLASGDDAVAESPSTDSDPETWRKTPLDDLVVYGLSKAVVKTFAEGGIHTLGDASDYQMGERGRPLTDVKGIGQTKVDKFEDAAAAWHRDHPMPTEQAAAQPIQVTSLQPQEEPQAETPEDARLKALEVECDQKPLRELIDHEFSQEMQQRLHGQGVDTVGQAVALLVDHEQAIASGRIAEEEINILQKVVDAWQQYFFDEHGE